MFDSMERTRKRRRRLLVPLLVTVTVVIGLLWSLSGTDARATIAYVEDMRTASEDLGVAGANLSTLVGDLSRVDRAEFVSVVDGVQSALEGAKLVADQDAPEPALAGAAALYRLAVERWTVGISEFSAAILTAADEADSALPESDLAEALVALRGGDRIYAALLDEFERDEVPDPVATLPTVNLLPTDAPISVIAPAWIAAARSVEGSLALHSSIGIEQIATDPEMLVAAADDVVIPATDDAIDVTVVVTNKGNTVSEPATVTILLVAIDGTEPREVTESVPAIEPGASTSVIFPDFEVFPSWNYVMDVTLAPGGPDGDVADNTQRIAFRINEATPTDSTDSTDAG